MATESVLKLGVPSRELLDRLVSEPPPLGLRASTVERRFHRDVYFDTLDRALETRGVTCRLRTDSDGRRTFTVKIRGPGATGDLVARNRYRAEVPDLDPAAIFQSASEPARILRAIVDPERLVSSIELETERRTRIARRGWIWGGGFEIRYDHVTARQGDLSGSFQELDVRRLREGRPSLEDLGSAFRETYGIAPILADKLARARRLLESIEVELLEREVRVSREVAVVTLHRGRIGLTFDGGVLRVPLGRGGGEEAVRTVLRDLFGTAQAQIRLLGTAPPVGTRPVLEVWMARRIPIDPGRDGRLEWPTLQDVVALVGTPAVRDARTLAALHVVARSDLPHEEEAWRPARAEGEPGPNGDDPRRHGLVSPAIRDPALPTRLLDPDRPVPEQFINQNLSHLAFNARVLALAEDETVPLLERVRFLAIAGRNVDEFFMVEVGKRKRQIADGKLAVEEDGLTPIEELDAVAVRARDLSARAQRCLAASLAPALGRHGIRILRWVDLSDEQRRYLTRHFNEQIYPVLTPLAASPGHPFPHIPNLRLALAALVRDPASGMEHFAAVRVPESLPRFVRLPERHDFVALEAVICANLQALFPGLEVMRAHSFRVTRSGDVRYDEDRALDLLQEIEEEVRRRPFGPVLRIEVERSMPPEMRELLLQEFRFESRDEPSTLYESDVYEVDWLLDLGGLKEIADLAIPELRFAPFDGRPLPGGSVFDRLQQQDVFAHHPYDAFESTVERFLLEAAADPDVLAVKVTLYRTSERSRIVEALLDAAERGKQVVVLVELKARYDEERNIQWAKRLESAGIHVVYGLLGLKTHAKIALVVRQEGGRMRRYELIGTGNLNAVTAQQYTDFSLLTANPAVGTDLHTLFNSISGYAAQTAFARLIVSPRHMLRRFLELIHREAEHVRGGGRGAIRAKVNGLADPETIQALYRASQAGVQIDLVVRGVCRLRPGVAGLSDRIRVVSILGRFLEHARVFHFHNAGHDEYYIGSADWRQRNLRRRVEVVTPVLDEAARARLDGILTVELADPTAWELRPDGAYVRRSNVGYGCGASAQERFIAAAQGAVAETTTR